MSRLTKKQQEAIAALDAIDMSDPDSGHWEADEIVLGAVPPEVREAYDRAKKRAAWWAYA